MKILVLNGSPRGNSSKTKILVDRFLKGYSIDSDSVEEVFLASENIKSCLGCFSCWNDNLGKCILNDGMKEVLNKYIHADVVIWSTPIYHFNMTSLLKKFIERTLPLNFPKIVKDETQNKYTHPQRYNLTNKTNILISSCGFPDQINFIGLIDSFTDILGKKLDLAITTTEGELLGVPALQNKVDKYLQNITRAGEEMRENNSVSPTLINKITSPIVEVDTFVKMANLSWNSNNNDKTNNNINNKNRKKGKNFLELMNLAFNKNNDLDEKKVIAMNFTDLGEDYYFLIENNTSKLIEGKAKDFDLKINTPFSLWKEISENKIDGSKAFYEKRYSIEGDMHLLIKLSDLYSDGSDSSSNNIIDSKSKKNKNYISDKEDKKSWLDNEAILSMSFIPWAILWFMNPSFTSLGIALISIIFLIFIKKKRTSTFDKNSLFFFVLINIMAIFDKNILSKTIIISYFAIAWIWLSTIVTSTPLTAEYSKHRYRGLDMSKDFLFMKINKNLTALWGTIFLLQGFLIIYYPHTLLILSLNIVGGVITKFYPQSILKS